VRDVPLEGLVDTLFSNDTCERKHAISLLVGYFIISIQVRRRGVFDNLLLDLEAYVPPTTRLLLDHLSKEITYKRIVRRREVQTLEYKGEKVIRDLFQALSEKPLSLIGLAALDPFGTGAARMLQEVVKTKEEGGWRDLERDKRDVIARSVCDFIAGMTNPYAEKYHRRLFEPGFGSSTDEL
jgi:dGTPase